MDRRRVLSMFGAMALATLMGVGVVAAEKTKANKAACACCGDACNCAPCCSDTCACCGDACDCSPCCDTTATAAVAKDKVKACCEKDSKAAKAVKGRDCCTATATRTRGTVAR